MILFISSSRKGIRKNHLKALVSFAASSPDFSLVETEAQTSLKSRHTIFSCNTCTIYLYLLDICQIGNLITIINHRLDKRKNMSYFISSVALIHKEREFIKY